MVLLRLALVNPVPAGFAGDSSEHVVQSPRGERSRHDGCGGVAGKKSDL